jgi:hypothetical protein
MSVEGYAVVLPFRAMFTVLNSVFRPQLSIKLQHCTCILVTVNFSDRISVKLTVSRLALIGTFLRRETMNDHHAMTLIHRHHIDDHSLSLLLTVSTMTDIDSRNIY